MEHGPSSREVKESFRVEDSYTSLAWFTSLFHPGLQGTSNGDPHKHACEWRGDIAFPVIDLFSSQVDDLCGPARDNRLRGCLDGLHALGRLSRSEASGSRIQRSSTSTHSAEAHPTCWSGMACRKRPPHAPLRAADQNQSPHPVHNSTERCAISPRRSFNSNIAHCFKSCWTDIRLGRMVRTC